MATMLLKEKFEKGLIEPGTYIRGFKPDYAECILSPGETGFEKNQVLNTEANMKWQLVCIDGQLALLADRKTVQKIFLQGEIGVQKGVAALQKYSQTCYSSERFHAKGIILTKEQFKQLPQTLKWSVFYYWLGSSYHDDGKEYSGYGLYSVIERSIYGNDLFKPNNLYSRNVCKGKSVRLAVILQDDIMIDEKNKLVDEKSQKKLTHMDKWINRKGY